MSWVSEQEKRRFAETTGLPHPSEWNKITDGDTRAIHIKAEIEAWRAGLEGPFIMQSACVDKNDYDEYSDRRVETHAWVRQELIANNLGMQEKRVINRTFYSSWTRLYWVFAIGEAQDGKANGRADQHRWTKTTAAYVYRR